MRGPVRRVVCEGGLHVSESAGLPAFVGKPADLFGSNLQLYRQLHPTDPTISDQHGQSVLSAIVTAKERGVGKFASRITADSGVAPSVPGP
jgi:hypothetical protein